MTKPGKDTAKSMLAMTLGFLVLYYIFRAPWLLTTAFIIALIGVLFPWLATKVEWVWLKLAVILGYINSRILLSIVFFLVVTPVAFIRRLTGKESVILKGGRETYFVTRNHRYSKKDLENPW